MTTTTTDPKDGPLPIEVPGYLTSEQLRKAGACENADVACRYFPEHGNRVPLTTDAVHKLCAGQRDYWHGNLVHWLSVALHDRPRFVRAYRAMREEIEIEFARWEAQGYPIKMADRYHTNYLESAKEIRRYIEAEFRKIDRHVLERADMGGRYLVIENLPGYYVNFVRYTTGTPLPEGGLLWYAGIIQRIWNAPDEPRQEEGLATL